MPNLIIPDSHVVFDSWPDDTNGFQVRTVIHVIASYVFLKAFRFCRYCQVEISYVLLFLRKYIYFEEKITLGII